VRIIDVAFDFVFGSHEGFTRAFSKQFGMSPKNYRQSRPPIKLFMPARLADYYLKLQKGGENLPKKLNVNTVFVQVVDRPPES
jgi:AraC-like DNA-binding protein